MARSCGVCKAFGPASGRVSWQCVTAHASPSAKVCDFPKPKACYRYLAVREDDMGHMQCPLRQPPAMPPLLAPLMQHLARNEAQQPHHVHPSLNANKNIDNIEWIMRGACLGKWFETNTRLGGRRRSEWGREGVTYCRKSVSRPTGAPERHIKRVDGAGGSTPGRRFTVFFGMPWGRV